MVRLEIFIDNEAKSQLRKVFSYIKRDSFQNAEKVREGIIASFKAIVNNPEQFQLIDTGKITMVLSGLMRYSDTG
jgi:plasmid stabilization system protein ParE